MVIQFQTKNLMEKDRINKIVIKFKILRIKKLKEKLKKKKYLIYLKQEKTIQKIKKIKRALAVNNHLSQIKIYNQPIIM